MRYLAIGHVCQDIAPGGRILGGAATYSTLTARALGWDATLVTRVAPEVDLSSLSGIECVRLPSDTTTIFENVYTAGGRAQILHAAAGPVRVSDVRRLHLRADVVHLAPIADEVEPAWVEAFPNATIGATPQGWLRQWDAAGRVSPREWRCAQTILRRADAIVTSIDDVSGDWTQIELWAAVARVVVATQGRDGCTVYVRGAATHMPAPNVTEVDPTGAGDIFAAAFFIRLHQAGDPIDAARFANCIAARSVSRTGLSGAPTPTDVKDCRGSATYPV